MNAGVCVKSTSPMPLTALNHGLRTLNDGLEYIYRNLNYCKNFLQMFCTNNNLSQVSG
jgi:hypothetical protein